MEVVSWFPFGDIVYDWRHYHCVVNVDRIGWPGYLGFFPVEIWGCLSFGIFAVDMVKCDTFELMDVPTWRW
jgi:hypothetical protein